MFKRIVNFEFGERESDYLAAKIFIFLITAIFFVCLGLFLLNESVGPVDRILGMILSTVFGFIAYQIGQSLIKLKD
jgi:hypothetical protein